MVIDDIVLHDEAPAEEMTPFPSRPIFTGWFDTGKQGKEWPGTFDIVAKMKPHTWKAAKSVPAPKEKGERLVVNLRGPRPLGANTRLRLQYLLADADSFTVTLRDAKSKESPPYSLPELPKGAQGRWLNAALDLSRHGLTSANEIVFHVPRGSLLVDDVLLYEP